MNSLIVTPMKYATASLLTVLAMGALPQIARADAIPATCLSTDSASRVMGASSLTMTGYSARLAETGARLHVQQVTARDKQGHLTLSNLRDANGLVSLGVLKLVHNSAPASCRSVEGRPALHTLRDALHQGAVAEMIWNDVAVSEGNKQYSAKQITVTLHAGQAPGSIDLAVTSTGLSAPGGSALPNSLRATLTIPEQTLENPNAPSGKITISSLEALWAKGRLDGSGWATIGHNAASSSGALHLAITDLGDLLTTIRPVVPAGITTALSIAQFMGHRNGNQVLWDLTLESGILKVNSIPIPVN
ncbi:hypothetical protein [Asaia astilbis]|uniref:hypothetical protein n=1 Tax=Asaia astilbis TaxID=610244 RepID=UPI0005689032|nr:hypothetical protein [Asaia astilbis]